MKHTTPILPSVRGKHAVLISHDLSQTGSPLLLVETATELQRAGARVELVTLADDADRSLLGARHKIKMVNVSDSFAHAAQADLVIANTSVAGPWVDQYLQMHPAGSRSLVWWVHEIEVDLYRGRMHSLAEAAVSIFDSRASLENWRQSDVRLPHTNRVLYPAVDDVLVRKALSYRTSDRPMDPAQSVLRNFAGGKTAMRERLGLKPYDFVLTIVGTYHPGKGQDLFLDTVSNLLRQHPYLPLKVIVIGFANEESRLDFLNRRDEDSGRALNDACAVEIVEDLAPYYSVSDVFVMNSQRLGENFGRVTTEAMIFRLPVLGTAAGGTLEIVRDGVTGLLHPVGVEGQRQLGENILTLIQNRKRAKAMGEAGYQRVLEKFTGPRFYSELESILEPILQSKPKSALKERSISG